MTNQLAVYEQFDTLQRVSMALYKSGYFKDATSEAQVIVKVLAGAELGLPPFASVAGIHIVQGRPVLGANVIATLVKNDPRYDYRVKQADDAACILTWYENGHPVGEAGYTMKEAAAAGLTGKDNWKKYPSDMLFARAISRGARRYAPGIFGGAPVYTPDEMGVDTDEDGYIEGEIVEVTHVQVAAPESVNTDTGELFAGPQYGNGDAVSAKAVAYYDQYVADKGDAPEDYNTLKAWYTNRAKNAAETAEQPVLVDAADNGAYSD